MPEISWTPRGEKQMNLTEAVVKTKWCPFARTAHFSHSGGVSENRNPGGYLVEGCNCIGSDCAAWRWAMKRNPDWTPGYGMMMGGWEEHPDDRSPTHIADPKRGYCGLAGRP
jgi:hypothetical protein